MAKKDTNAYGDPIPFHGMAPCRFLPDQTPIQVGKVYVYAADISDRCPGRAQLRKGDLVTATSS